MGLPVGNILGFDIGGVNTKSVLVQISGDSVSVVGNRSRYFPFWQKSKEDLPALLKSMSEELGATVDTPTCVSITAELSDVYTTKREGILHIVSALQQVFPLNSILIFTVEGSFKTPSELQRNPMLAAAANWVATSRWVAARYPNCVFIDVGSTSVDIIPILEGKIVSRGRTDLTRLQNGELVYTGVLRATIPSVSHVVPLRGGQCPVSFEKFASMADVHLILNYISESQYTSETADGRPPTRDFSYARLARIVCADLEEVTREEVSIFARFLHQKQIEQVANALREVTSRLPKHLPFVLTGLGADILGVPACKNFDKNRHRILISESLGNDLDVMSSAYAVAWCYWQDFILG
ncbi:MAG: hypothetical protein RBG13Loki_3991 [Promethearchaeota archaeon CR_4]|nr:MAG: hypothetical protein RBG13Loki_3991 [Candidatus Lokiarchaeota archaeon CR_4]